MKKLFLLFAASALSACVDPNDTLVNTRPDQANASDQRYIQNRIVSSMKDPGAAQLRAVRSFDLSNGQGRAICGEVNGKNSFGAYVGFQPFYLRVKDGAVVSEWVGSPASQFLGQMAVEACSQAASGQMTVKG